ncbi:Uncharacterized conserved protein, contains ParB-like and HNH nuclease domains [Arboricoccus pini]|uniref:Uncharacterized conserved protein, contains ParB-like and HNH nuclease domains n=1 Tax=Arboricoccus pini TaxID=1963835 RepID=A0A212QWR4_9PROT|nr:DUF262 domain-containing protein [Arboricoccus pini]SNB64145.1 Uncharacterized conserved protein, contains ParB-like and HNH nuclease domains [Arboricoccus pini]
MSGIEGKARTVRELLKGVKYSIDYYQREYKWGEKQARELIDDLTGKFLEDYQPIHQRKQVAGYPHYFLGAIIISKKDNANFIVDGQQRLTTLTILLMLLRNLQKERDDQVNVDELIVSEKFGEKSFNLDVDERTPCMDALFESQPFDASNRAPSVQNLAARYADMEGAWPEELRGDALPYFIDWLLENVHLVEITAYSDDDAYTIFETMNDRGLSLSPTDMLKGYLLANIATNKRVAANARWRERIATLNEVGKEVEADFFKAWLRSQYATKIRERKRGAKAEDFDRIGTEFHRWLRDASEAISLKKEDDFFRLIDRDFDFYARHYLLALEASEKRVDGLEAIQYNAQNGFTLQYMLLLAPLKPDDDPELAKRKMNIVANFLDILLAWRLWNFRSIAYSTMQYAMFLVMRDIRGLEPKPLAKKLYDVLSQEKETFESNDRLRVHQQNRYAIHRLLARLTEYVETQSGQPSRYAEYVAEGAGRYEVEHVWADHAERHTNEFAHTADFSEHRNRIGGLLLLPKQFNASYGDLPYQEKLPYYRTQNLLAHSLHEECYTRNPGFVRFVSESKLPFHPIAQFKKDDLDERSVLYRLLAERVWNPQRILRMGGIE